MTIILTKPVRVGGVALAAATTQTFAADVEADLVARGSAAYTINPTIGQGGVPVMADINNFTGGIRYTIAGSQVSLPDPARTFPLKLALVGDSVTQNGAINVPLSYTGVEKGCYSTALTTTNLNATTASGFVVAAYADAYCGQSDSVVLAFDGSRSMTVNVASEGVGTPVDVTGGGFFRLVSAGGSKGAIVQIRWDPRVGTRPGATSDTTSSSLGTRTRHLMLSGAWCAPALAMNGYGSISVMNYGISGDSTTDILNRIEQVTDWSPEVVLLMTGINNYSGATAVADIKAIVSALNAAGAFVLISTTLPGAMPTATAAKQLSNLVNQVFLMAKSPLYRCDVVDLFSLMTAPSTASGNGVVNATYYRTDYTHPNILGTMQGIAPKLLAAIQRVIPPLRPALTSAMDAYDATYNPQGNLMGSVGAFAGIAGTLGASPTPTGHLATGWTDSIYGTNQFASVVYTAPDDGTYARTDAAGNWQRIVASTAGTGSCVRVIYSTITGLAAGTKFRVHCTARISSATLVNKFDIYVSQTCSANGNSENYATSIGNNAIMNSGTLTDTGAMYFSSEVMTAPPEITAAYLYIRYGCALGGSMTLDVQDARVEIIP